MDFKLSEKSTIVCENNFVLNNNDYLNKLALSVREKEVLDLIIKGENNDEISKILLISTNTVKKHTESIFKKLHVKNRVQAAVLIVRMNSRSGNA